MKKKPFDQCKKCLPAKCCLYIALEIDEPETRSDFEYLLWKISHRNVSAYVYRKKWHLRFASRCKFLSKENTCDIYDKRPKVCRDHSIDECEYHGEDYGFKHYFKTYNQLLKYIREEYPRWRI